MKTVNKQWWHELLLPEDDFPTVGDVPPLIKRRKEWRWINPVREIMIKVPNPN